MQELELGKWILPQPEDKKEYVPIPRLARTVPFGYRKDENDDNWLIPIPLELEALEKAKVYVKQYAVRKVAIWLTKVTGREISHVGLSKRLKNEQSHKRKSSTYRKLADRYEEALKKAEEYEKRTGTGQNSFFTTDRYGAIRNSFSNNSGDSTTSTGS